MNIIPIMDGNNFPSKNQVCESRLHMVLKFLNHDLFPILNLLYRYIKTYRDRGRIDR